MRRKKEYLTYSAWPAAHKALWEAAFAPATDMFEDGGPGAHLAKRTVSQLQYTYGKFLYFLLVKHLGLLNSASAERVTVRIIEQFVKAQPATCGGITRSIYLYHLWLALHYLYPGEDWRWLIAITNRVKARAKAKPAQYHLVTSEVLYKLGLKLIDRALDSARPLMNWRVHAAYRDGLIIAMLALIPLRRRTLAALRIGKHLKKSGNLWFLDIPAEDVKTGRSLDYPISLELSERIDVYVNEIRPQVRGARTHDYLWASNRGRPMHDQAIYSAVRQRTHKALGFPINLQRFRRAAATLWSIRDPANVRGAKDLLGHASFATTEKHYIMAQTRLAGRVLACAVDRLKEQRRR